MMDTEAPTAPTAPPLTEQDLEEFRRALEEEPPTLCVFWINGEPCADEATWLAVPSCNPSHGGAACTRCRSLLEAYAQTRGVRCQNCPGAYVSVEWRAL